MRSSRPSRLTPAAARTTAERPSVSSLRSRVSRFPRSGTIRRSGRAWRSCAPRRRLLVPMSAAGRKFRQALSVTGDQHIRGGFALGDGSDGKPLGDVRRHVLHAVDGYVHAPVPQGLLDLLDEETLAAHLGERHVEDLVALGLDDRELDGHPGEARQQRRADPLGLPQRKLAARGSRW